MLRNLNNEGKKENKIISKKIKISGIRFNELYTNYINRRVKYVLYLLVI